LRIIIICKKYYVYILVSSKIIQFDVFVNKLLRLIISHHIREDEWTLNAIMKVTEWEITARERALGNLLIEYKHQGYAYRAFKSWVSIEK